MYDEPVRLIPINMKPSKSVARWWWWRVWKFEAGRRVARFKRWWRAN